MGELTGIRRACSEGATYQEQAVAVKNRLSCRYPNWLPDNAMMRARNRRREDLLMGNNTSKNNTANNECLTFSIKHSKQ